MKENKIILSSAAENAIRALRHKEGTLNVYVNTLDRLFSLVLHQADEIGISDYEAMSTMRVLDMIRDDLRSLAAAPRTESPADGPVAVPVLPGADCIDFDPSPDINPSSDSESKNM